MKINKLLFYTAGAGALAAAFAFAGNRSQNNLPATVMAQSGLIRTSDGFYYRDLNKNGKLDVYEDSRQPIEDRVQDLLKKMTLEEKAGMMFYSPIRVNADGSIEDKPASGLLASLSPVGVN
jgi:beta-glucosidase